jgi:5-methylthioadenosine/S-adenosylhomocysteine deaminase
MENQSKILLKNVILDNKSVNIRIDNAKIAQISSYDIEIENSCYQTIDGQNKLAVLPPFYNGHTHCSMSLFKGYADDLELMDWLENHIWPAEANLTKEDVYAASRLAILEMIKSGTVFFNDMYWFQTETLRACEELKIRAELGLFYICDENGEVLERNQKSSCELIEMAKKASSRISISCAPHGVYTVSDKVLSSIAQEAKTFNRRIHIHASETALEVENCKKRTNASPIIHLKNLGLLTNNTILAHAVHLDDEDRFAIAQAGATIVHNPVSNLKLVSGLFDFEKNKKANCNIILGTDGNASNNNLSLFDEMKSAALMAKLVSQDPKAGNVNDIFNAATVNSAKAFGIDAGIQVGKVADLMLISLDNPIMQANHNTISNLIYAADSSVVDTVICDGNILMLHRFVPQEEEILHHAQACCRKFRR